MTDRELMQQTLEALIWTTGSDDFGDGGKAREGALKLLFPSITALRDRLAQPEQEQKPTVKQSLTVEQPEQEPVALPEKMYEFVPTPEPSKWHHPECEGQCIACLIEQVVQEAYGSQGLGYLQRHLTSPPQRKPLTDEEIKRMAAPWFLSMYWPLCNTFARAIETAHGITGEQP